MKYDKVADIPEDVIKLADKCKHGLPYNQLTLGGHRSSIDLNDMERHIGANPIRTNEELEAAKECLARCEGEAKKETRCALCYGFKETPLRVDPLGGYVCLTCIDKQLHAALDVVQATDKAVKWDGEGLPMVDDWVEWKGKRGGYWVKALIVGIDKDQVVFKHSADSEYKAGKFEVFDLFDIDMRPIKTEAELAAEKAAEERENEICNLESFLKQNTTLFETSCKGIAEVIFDGYIINREGK